MGSHRAAAGGRMRSLRVAAAAAGLALALGATAATAALLVPMDLEQTDHLKAYGVAYWALEKGYRVEWLLNYRAGSLLVLDGGQDVVEECTFRGVLSEPVDGAPLAAVYSTI